MPISLLITLEGSQVIFALQKKKKNPKTQKEQKSNSVFPEWKGKHCDVSRAGRTRMVYGRHVGAISRPWWPPFLEYLGLRAIAAREGEGETQCWAKPVFLFLQKVVSGTQEDSSDQNLRDEPRIDVSGPMNGAEATRLSHRPNAGGSNSSTQAEFLSEETLKSHAWAT